MTNRGSKPSILICGAGIAGPALAHWLLRAGFAPTLIERAPALREGGYVIDFWGKAYDLIEEAGLLPQVLHAGYQMRELRLVDRVGRRAASFQLDVLRDALGERFTSLPRSALSAVLFHSIAARIETSFANSVVGLEPARGGVRVSFERGPARHFDLVIGADGLHSIVRHLAFGPEQQFERFLGYTVAAFEASGYRPRDEESYVGHSAPGRLLARMSLRGDRTLFLLVAHEHDGRIPPVDDRAQQRAYLHERFGTMGWEARSVLAALERGGPLYFERMSQIRMNRWASGRIALLGDAAWAPSLLAGEGAGLAIIGAYVLAGQLSSRDDWDAALGSYEARMRPFVTAKQTSAAAFGGAFAPKTRLGILLRAQVVRLLSLPFVARRVLASSLRDPIALESYAQLHHPVTPLGASGGGRQSSAPATNARA
jgi:2-polyprenyl-6-methoxyphenol hydroxylase-like FAD-dependent oxidoreductase